MSHQRCLGVKDYSLEEIARNGRTSKKTYRNISRNFHRYVRRKGLTLPVHVSMVPLVVRQHRPKVEEVKIKYPMISLKSWGTYLLANHPRFVLGGFSLNDTERYTAVYSQFWERYQQIDPGHEFFEHHPPAEWGHCIPYAIHGDEGRGKGKTPILIQSYQMVIGPSGVDSTNMSG